MKKLFIVLPLILIIFFCQSAAAQEHFDLSGQVRLGFHSSLGAIYGTSCATWEIELTVQNNSYSTIFFDKIIASWAAEDRPGLTTTTTCTDETESSGLFWKLRPREEESFSFGSNGYTDKIIHDAQGEPILFQVGFFYQEQLIGVYASTLPALKSLSFEKETPLFFR